MEKIAHKLRKSVEAAERKRKGQIPLTHHEKEDIEKFAALNYAKENGLNRPPHIEVIIKQDFIEKATQASPKEIADFMISLGFEKINDTSFTNGEYTVSDLFPRNVLKDENDIIYVVDNIVAKNE